MLRRTARRSMVPSLNEENLGKSKQEAVQTHWNKESLRAGSAGSEGAGVAVGLKVQVGVHVSVGLEVQVGVHVAVGPTVGPRVVGSRVGNLVGLNASTVGCGAGLAVGTTVCCGSAVVATSEPKSAAPVST